MRVKIPRLVIAGLAGDSGKTLVSLGLARALAERGLKVRTFKKGPDYIDAAWLGMAARSTCRNLDTFLMSDEAMAGALATASTDADIILVEGNRGLFDGVDVEGSHSTAVLARRLAAPVVLVLDVTKMTRTAAALVLGCRALDPEVDLAGVILNRVGCGRHENIVREAVAGKAGTPVLGAIRRIRGDDPLPGRHLGLVTTAEHPDPDETIERVIQDLGLGEWFDSLSDGLDTELDSGGGGLSAGEQQLLAFTRIFLKDPGLVILDEASSRLDPATEHLIEQAVDKLVQNRTAIVIAHRLGTVQRAHEIMILENGHIHEYGTRLNLVGDPNSRFYSLLQTGMMEEVLA